VLACAIERDVVTCVGMPHDAACRVVPQHAFDPSCRRLCAVAHDDHAGVLRVADTHAAAMM
jgi:hypothetical protein